MFDCVRSIDQINVSGVSYILLDIEGTISDIQFVKNVLFPYSYKQLPQFVRDHADFLRAQIVDVVTYASLEGARNQTFPDSIETAIGQLRKWTLEDLKHPALKYIQGLIWEEGFRENLFKAHLYSEVVPTLRAWKEQGLSIGIYSSGSKQAQTLFFEHTEFGDIRSYFTDFFDLEVGSKRESSSYDKIAFLLGLRSDRVLFASDIEAELMAAKSSGFRAVLVERPKE